MIGFNPPDEIWAKRARIALLGVDFQGREAVFTPLAPVYRTLSALTTIAHEGWWPAATESNLLVTHVPQGSPMLDAIYALRRGTRITFVGLAGSLRGDPIGTVVEPATALVAWPGFECGRHGYGNAVGGASRSHPKPFIGTPVRVASVCCLAQSTQQHARLARHADCVDFETGPLFEAARVCGHPVRSLLVISDANSEGAVFASEPADTRDVLDTVCWKVMSTMAREVPRDV